MDALKDGIEEIGCLLCGGAGRPTPVGREEEGVDFRIRRCAACDLYFVSPRPTREAIGRWYGGDYYAYREMDTGEVERVLRRKSTRTALLAGRKPGRVLDVGCGSGYDLLRLKERGWRTFGIELDGRAAAEARKGGIEVFEGSAERADFPDGHFDAITAMHCLEHVHDPVAVLANLGRMLAPGGAIYAMVPFIDSTSFRLFGNHWRNLELPRHLFFYTRRSLAPIAERAGLRVMRYVFHSGTRGFRFSLEYLLRARAPRLLPLMRPIRKKGPGKFIFRTACRFLGDGLRAGDLVYAILGASKVPRPTSQVKSQVEG